jgi:hypothetical protein
MNMLINFISKDDLNICREFENTEHVRNSLGLLGRTDFDLHSFLFRFLRGEMTPTQDV